jgi:hypothetical protein
MNFENYLKKKLQDPKFRALYKRTRKELGKDMNKARNKAGKRVRIPPEVRKAYSKVKSALAGNALSCVAWYTKPLPLAYSGQTPQELWQQGKKDFVMWLLQPPVVN